MRKSCRVSGAIQLPASSVTSQLSVPLDTEGSRMAANDRLQTGGRDRHAGQGGGTGGWDSWVGRTGRAFGWGRDVVQLGGTDGGSESRER